MRLGRAMRIRRGRAAGAARRHGERSPRGWSGAAASSIITARCSSISKIRHAPASGPGSGATPVLSDDRAEDEAEGGEAQQAARL